MSADTNPQIIPTAGDSVEQATAAAAAAAANPSGPSGAPAANMQTIASMDDLRTKNPELYRLVTEGIGTTICNRMKDHQDKIKELNRKMRQDNER